MIQYQDTVWCNGCGVEILWPPMMVGDRTFCCLDCQQGLGCDCGEDHQEDQFRQENASLNADSLTQA